MTHRDRKPRKTGVAKPKARRARTKTSRRPAPVPAQAPLAPFTFTLERAGERRPATFYATTARAARGLAEAWASPRGWVVGDAP